MHRDWPKEGRLGVNNFIIWLATLSRWQNLGLWLAEGLKSGSEHAHSHDLICLNVHSLIHLFIHSGYFYSATVLPLQVLYYSEAFPTQHGYCARISRRSATGNCEWRTCPRSLRGG